ncbi:MAG: proline dehydrogenase family protein [Candidatus Eremiobacteraeota bacterium]|nr:proline dehydrogenase family protein [Candidatus Eremiobacteraeota bacterium]
MHRNGMRLGASRFVAGESAEEFIRAAKLANARGFAVAAGILGEDTRDRRAAEAAAAAYIELLHQIDGAAIDSTVALKVTHLGLNVDKELTFESVAAVAATAQRLNNFVRLDMEQSSHVDDTIAIYSRLRRRGIQNIGFVLQAYLYRSLDDLAQLLPFGTNVRIVKGAYLEPASVAYQNKADVDANFMRLLARSLRDGAFTAVATHDPAIVQAALELIDERQIPRERLEFQMLYGISARLADTLRERGHRVRLAIPFGSYWFPYLMRRLAERPANLGFFLRNALLPS